MRKVMLATGHKTTAMAEMYADLAQEEDFTEVAKAVKGAFENIIPFERRVTRRHSREWLHGLKNNSARRR